MVGRFKFQRAVRDVMFRKKVFQSGFYRFHLFQIIDYDVSRDGIFGG